MRRVLLLLALAGCTTQPKAQTSTAAQMYPTYRALHEAIVTPTCGPRGGVCHNSKQFPDLHTPENMLAVIGQRCNQLTADPLAILDECEPRGDLLVIKGGPDAGFRTRVGYVFADGANPPKWASITTHDPIPHDAANVPFSIVRDANPAASNEIIFPSILTTKAGQYSATMTGIQSALSSGQRFFFLSPFTPGLDAQVQLGDPNQDGTFGYDLGSALIKPGDTQRSFLVQRILGTVPPRMPLANNDLTSDQLYALQCWIHQLEPDGSNADGPISYGRCPASF